MRSYRQFAAVYDRLMEEMPYAEWMSFARRCFEKYGVPKTVVDLGCSQTTRVRRECMWSHESLM